MDAQHDDGRKDWSEPRLMQGSASGTDYLEGKGSDGTSSASTTSFV